MELNGKIIHSKRKNNFFFKLKYFKMMKQERKSFKLFKEMKLTNFSYLNNSLET